MNILVIGSGFVGKKASQYLRSKGHFVTGVTRSFEKIPSLLPFFDKVLNWDESTFFTAFENQEIVLFSAAPGHSAANLLESYKKTYLENANRIKVASSSLKQIIYTSSTSVYGDLQGQNATEDLPLEASSETQKILIETENVLLSTNKASILRLGEIIGEGRTLEERIRARINAPFPGNGSAITNLSQLTDIIYAIDFVIENSLFGIYNVTSDLHITRKVLYHKICQRLNLPDVIWDETLFSHHMGNKKVVSDKIKKAGFTFLADPDEGVYLKSVPFSS